MPAITDPSTVSAAERRTEVACILACGLVRCLRAARARASLPPAESGDSGDIALELGEHSRLAAGDDSAERTARATEQTARHTKRLVEASNKGLAFG